MTPKEFSFYGKVRAEKHHGRTRRFFITIPRTIVETAGWERGQVLEVKVREL